MLFCHGAWPRKWAEESENAKLINLYVLERLSPGAFHAETLWIQIHSVLKKIILKQFNGKVEHVGIGQDFLKKKEQ